jgi:GrpB-like predicted nucleotidyltransferase (UPF0157 family)
MGLREEITLEADPVWTDRYEREREFVASTAPEGLVGVFHVGSTAIPDVPGKPALDVLAVYEDDDAMRAAAEALADAEGYERHAGEGDSALVIRWEAEEAAFLKLYTRDDEKVRAQLAFRDYLRDHPDAREEYTAVKREAVADHPEDPEAYTDAKSEIVSEILDRAREAGYEDDFPEYA